MTSFETLGGRALLPAIVLSVLLTGALQPASAQCADSPGCVLVWSDEFDGTEVDPSKWTFQVGTGTQYGLPAGWGNNELQFYRAENATVADGLLTITAKEDGFSGEDYTSARMRSLAKGEWTFGRMEMRARMPTGQGMWPAFWMLPTDPSIYGTWAASGEIDIVEYIGSEPDRILGTIHYGGPYPDNQYSGNSYFLTGETFNDDFHVFAVEWESGEIRWYVDGLLYSVRNDWYSTGGPYPAPFDIDFHLLLNLAVGGNLPGAPDASTVFPQEYVVDYVRVYQVPYVPTTIAITSPTAAAALTPGEDLTITVGTNDDSSVQFVEFLQGKAFLGVDTMPPFELTIPDASAGCYTLGARARDAGGRLATAEPVAIMVGPGCQQGPYRITPTPVPGTIEVEDYDVGGQGLAYSDSDPTNNGGGYRPDEGVDLETTTDAGYGYNLGWVTSGEWIEFTVDARAGTYDVEFRVASDLSGGTLHLEVDGVDKTGPVTVPRTFGWQTWTTVRTSGVTFDAGTQTLRLVIDAGAFNVNKITIPAPPPGPVGAVPNGREVAGVPLTVTAGADGDLVLDWGASCLAADDDYVVYEGPLGSFEDRAAVTCSTGGATTWSVTPATGSRYYLVAPTNGVFEGSLGTDGTGAERIPGSTVCHPQTIGECP